MNKERFDAVEETIKFVEKLKKNNCDKHITINVHSVEIKKMHQENVSNFDLRKNDLNNLYLTSQIIMHGAGLYEITLYSETINDINDIKEVENGNE